MQKLALTFSLLAASLLAGCNNGNGPAGGSGLIETTESIVSAETRGRVIDHRFSEGMTVLPGDTLLVIDPSRMELELASARAGLDVLKSQLNTARVAVKQAVRAEQFAVSEFKRVEKLIKSGSSTDRQLDQTRFNRDQAEIGREAAEAQVGSLQAQLLQAEAGIARLERQLQDFYPQAPISGTILEKFVEAGELLAPGAPIARIAETDTVWVKVYLPAARFATVKLGERATVDIESGDHQFQGKVIWTSDEAEFTPKNIQTAEARADLVYAVKVSIANPDRILKTGMPVYVTLEN